MFTNFRYTDNNVTYKISSSSLHFWEPSVFWNDLKNLILPQLKTGWYYLWKKETLQCLLKTITLPLTREQSGSISSTPSSKRLLGNRATVKLQYVYFLGLLSRQN